MLRELRQLPSVSQDPPLCESCVAQLPAKSASKKFLLQKIMFSNGTFGDDVA